MRTHSIICLSLISIAVILLAACSSSSSSDPGAAGTSTATLPTASMKNIPLSNGNNAQATFSFTVPGDMKQTGSASIDISATLANMSLSSTMIAEGETGSRFETLRMLARALISNAHAMVMTDVTVHFSYLGDPAVCMSPITMGPYTVIGAIDEALSSADTSADVPTSVRNLANSGGFEVCVQAISPVDGFISVPEVVVDFEECEPATMVFEGTWSGTYSCDGDPLQNITLTVTRNANGTYSYDPDSLDEAYTGNVCGDEFRFDGGATNNAYDESGTLVVDGDTAVKTSTYRLNGSIGGGSCTDNLTRVFSIGS